MLEVLQAGGNDEKWESASCHEMKHLHLISEGKQFSEKSVGCDTQGLHL